MLEGNRYAIKLLLVRCYMYEKINFVHKVRFTGTKVAERSVLFYSDTIRHKEKSPVTKLIVRWLQYSIRNSFEDKLV